MKRFLIALLLANSTLGAVYNVELPGGGILLINGLPYVNPAITNSATVTWSVDGFGRILATSVGGSANVYTSSNNIFTGTNTFSVDTSFLGPASFDTLFAGTLTVTNPFPARGITNATASRFAVFGADNRLTNDIAETGTGAPVRAVSPALTGSPTVPTAAAGTSNTVAASTKYVDDAVASVSVTSDPFAENPAGIIELDEEFFGGGSSDPSLAAFWTKAGVISGTATQFTDTNHWGVMRSRATTTSPGFAGLLATVNAGVAIGAGRLKSEWIIKTPAASATANEYVLQVGFGTTQAGTNQTHGIYAQYCHQWNSGNWEFIVRTNSTEVVSSTATAFAATSWTKFTYDAYITNAASYALIFSINGTPVATNTTGIPYAVAMAPMLNLVRTNGTGDIDVWFDKFWMKFQPTVSR
jgi:hypothetical protein